MKAESNRNLGIERQKTEQSRTEQAYEVIVSLLENEVKVVCCRLVIRTIRGESRRKNIKGKKSSSWCKVYRGVKRSELGNKKKRKSGNDSDNTHASGKAKIKEKEGIMVYEAKKPTKENAGANASAHA